jgi:hypothetical protein
MPVQVGIFSKSCFKSAKYMVSNLLIHGAGGSGQAIPPSFGSELHAFSGQQTETPWHVAVVATTDAKPRSCLNKVLQKSWLNGFAFISRARRPEQTHQIAPLEQIEL